jgi:hypothetical protein
MVKATCSYRCHGARPARHDLITLVFLDSRRALGQSKRGHRAEADLDGLRLSVANDFAGHAAR